jgi:hypothetical protein
VKITAVKLLRLAGTMALDGAFWEERLVRPVDLYPEHAAEGATWLAAAGPGRYRMESIFLRVETDSDGLVGVGGPVPADVAYVIARQLAPQVIGHDPLAVERIWDRLYRLLIHGGKGTPMLGLSALDCALWDPMASSCRPTSRAWVWSSTRRRRTRSRSSRSENGLTPGRARSSLRGCSTRRTTRRVVARPDRTRAATPTRTAPVRGAARSG